MRLELNLEIVTPLFLGGADPNQSELRPASVRGALRYWLRAALGGAFDHPANLLEQLWAQECAVFGATDSASPIIVRLGGMATRMMNYNLDKGPHGNRLPTGHNYLYYSTRDLGENNRTPFAPNPQTPIRLTLQTRPGLAQATAILQKAGVGAWLLTHLGGLGMRARRCAGSLQVASMPTNANNTLDLPEFTITASTTDELKTALESGLRGLRAMLGSAARPTREYDVLHPDCCRVWVISHQPACRTWKEAVETTGSAMQTFRATQGPNRNTDNSIFGVPILHGPNHGLERRASPLWLRITRLTSGEYVTVATLFKADFKDGRHEVGGGYALIESFIASLGGREVIY